MSALSWIFWTYCKILELVVGYQSADPKAVAESLSSITVDYEQYWKSFPERKNRWHAESVVIGTEFQGRGIGKLLMAEVIKRAESEGVCVGLEASAPGEYLYRRSVR
jgi:ribosomal protein S18 acetylase RimI-like enzyme